LIAQLPHALPADVKIALLLDSTSDTIRTMAQWLFDKAGQAMLILDDDRLRSSRGAVVGWINNTDAHSIRGAHVGWFHGGVLYDRKNRVLGFLANATGSLPSRPCLSGTPGMPGFPGVPGRPGLSGTPGRPGFGGWSDETLATYF
jgi:4-fold beta-flower domain-containing protein